MDRDVVIRAEGLGKRYAIGHRALGNTPTLRDAIVSTLGGLARTTSDMLRGRALIAGDEIEEFRALRDVNFEVRRGEVVGIIGRNGAGKSTLLKILSRITDPSEGRVEIRGRVASLLEVGTGFHPELTGRENIFLNGAILGMSRAEIRRKFEEIVAFAEVEKFLDTPVKRFSSGMYVRLAFAVAAHLEPEILIVDEVLAVGDAEFQKKSLGKMHDIAGAGRTVLFVSHNLAAVAALCNHGLLLDAGHLLRESSIHEAIAAYSDLSGARTDYRLADGVAKGPIHIASALAELRGDTVVLQVEVNSDRAKKLILNARCRDPLGAPLGIASLGGFDPDTMVRLVRGSNRFMMEITLPPLANGTYRIDLDLEEPYAHYHDVAPDAVGFEMLRSPRNHGRTLQIDWRQGPVELPSRQIAAAAEQVSR